MNDNVNVMESFVGRCEELSGQLKQMKELYTQM